MVDDEYPGQDALSAVSPTAAHCHRVPATRMTRAELHRRAGWKPPPVNGDEVIETSAMFLCGHLGSPCVSCGDVADVLCDFPIGEEERTCDRPLCSRCSPTIGEDKNYCIPHAKDGPGMLLFDFAGIKRIPEARIAAAKPRLPRAPKEMSRWRTVNMQTIGGLACWVVMSAWTHEIGARIHARKIGGEVQTWAEFIAWHRSQWPLKPRKR